MTTIACKPDVHDDKPFCADRWLHETGAALDHATLCAKQAGKTFATPAEWWEAREVAETASHTVVAALVAAHGRLMLSERPAALPPTDPGERSAAAKLRALGHEWIHGEWRQTRNRSPNHETLVLLRALNQHCADTGARDLVADISREIARLSGATDLTVRSLYDSPLGVPLVFGNGRPGRTHFAATATMRELVDFAAEKNDRVARFADAADMAITVLESAASGSNQRDSMLVAAKALRQA